MYFCAGDVHRDTVGLGSSHKLGLPQKLFLNKLCSKSVITWLVSNWNRVNMLTCEVQYSLRCFSSLSCSDGDDMTASDAGTSNRSASLTGSSGPASVTLSHVGDSGKVKMVDVSSKSETSRVATAAGRVKLGGLAFRLVAENRTKKGDVLSTAQLAGIMAAKQTSRLIPLCHNVTLTSVDVALTLDSASMSVVIQCTARSLGQTGVEMEALTGVSVAALTVYDMCKAVSHDMVISDIQLVSKTGGKLDVFRHGVL